MKIKIVGTLNDTQQGAVSRAKAYHGKQPHKEFYADCVIWYKNDWAAIIPMQHSAYVQVSLPNPIPHRKGFFRVRAGADTAFTQCMTSSESVMCDEPIPIYPDPSGLFTITENDPYASYLTFQNQNLKWSGADSIPTAVWHVGADAVSSVAEGPAITLVVPEDCVLPESATAPPILYTFRDAPPVATPFKAALSEMAGRWITDWDNAQTTTVRTRRDAWFKKNHDTVIIQLKAGTFTYAGWDYFLKASARVSSHTKRLILMGVSYVDEVTFDTSENLSTAGTKVTERTTTLYYTAPDGAVRTQDITGSLTQVVTQHYIPISTPALKSRVDTFSQWYGLEDTAMPGTSLGAVEALQAHQFLRDGGAHYGMGLLWSGVVQEGVNATSETGPPGNPFLHYVGGGVSSGTGEAWAPPWPHASCSMVGASPPIILTYRGEVGVTYSATAGVLAWNDSALFGIVGVEIVLFGPTGLGMFGVWPTDGSIDSVDVYGGIAFTYSHSTGAFSISSFSPPLDNNGNEVEAVTIPLDGATLPTYNAVVRYSGLHWADTIVAADAANAALRPPPEGVTDTRTPNQKLQYAIQTAI